MSLSNTQRFFFFFLSISVCFLINIDFLLVDFPSKHAWPVDGDGILASKCCFAIYLENNLAV